MNRRMQLANDPQVKSFTPEAVVCNVCSLPVVLQGDGDYSLVSWHEHKLSCSSLPVPSTGDVIRPPISNADTEATLVGTSSSPPRGTKRQREDEKDAEDPTLATIVDLDTRPTTKRRTESYEPPKGFLPSLWRWATTEAKAFVKAAFGSIEEMKNGAGEGNIVASKV